MRRAGPASSGLWAVDVVGPARVVVLAARDDEGMEHVHVRVDAARHDDLARRVDVSMPICETVNAILNRGADLREAFHGLWTRPIEGEPRALDISLANPVQAVTPAITEKI